MRLRCNRVWTSHYRMDTCVFINKKKGLGVDYSQMLNVLYGEIPERDKFKFMDGIEAVPDKGFADINDFTVRKNKLWHHLHFTGIFNDGTTIKCVEDVSDHITDNIKMLINHDIRTLHKLRTVSGEFKVCELLTKSTDVEVLRRVLMPNMLLPIAETGMFKTVTLICSVGNDVVGYVEYCRCNSCKNGIYVKTLVSINKGAGKCLIDSLISKYDVISLDVMDDGSGKLYDYYEKLGFREDYEDGKFILITRSLQCKK